MSVSVLLSTSFIGDCKDYKNQNETDQLEKSFHNFPKIMINLHQNVSLIKY